MLSIDLRSDTLTSPSLEMRTAIFAACVGDDAYGEDKSVRQLEEFCAGMFGKEEALFMPSGTMSNQVAVRSHTVPGDEVITDKSYHLNYFESSQTSALCGVSLNLCRSKDGLITCDDLYQAMDTKYRGHVYAEPKLLFLENTVNSACGASYTPSQVLNLSQIAERYGIRVHVDGARILNACVATGTDPIKHGANVDSLSLCFAKGLGAPFGSILVGSKQFISSARKYRKWFGGTMHQAGFMAAAALLALQKDWRTELNRDHYNAQKIADALREVLPSELVQYRGTNIVMVSVVDFNHPISDFINDLRKQGVLAFPWNQRLIRFVTHKDLTDSQIDRCAEVIKCYFGNIFNQLYSKSCVFKI